MSDRIDGVEELNSDGPAIAGDERPLSVLLADDEESLRRILARELVRRGHRVIPAPDGRAALTLLEQEEFDVAVLDVRMPNLDGLSVLRQLKDELAAPEVILLTGNATVETAVEAMKAGAYDFVAKPCRIEVLDALIRAAARKRSLRRENEQLRRREEHREEAPEARIAQGWNSVAMGPILRLIERMAPSDLPVLILGESGVGKELVAREIHRRSRRTRGPFVDLNCAAIPETLLESELFGNEKGAFTGAQSARAGLLEAADGGTLFLDEVGELPAALQVKLLRVLETMSFFRVGGRRKVTVNVRLVAATNRDLAQAAQRGTFRTDLLYRINAGTIQVPPLRERSEEVAALSRAFLAQIDPQLEFDPGLLDALARYSWPGNVRELRNVIERAALLARGGRISSVDLPHEVFETSMARHPAAEGPHGTAAYAPETMRANPSVPASLEALERERILEVLENTRWNRGRAAGILGISVRTLYRKIKAFGLDNEPANV
jgi:DNA-binding NtrC family response regulator